MENGEELERKIEEGLNKLKKDMKEIKKLDKLASELEESGVEE